MTARRRGRMIYAKVSWAVAVSSRPFANLKVAQRSCSVSGSSLKTTFFCASRGREDSQRSLRRVNQRIALSVNPVSAEPVCVCVPAQIRRVQHGPATDSLRLRTDSTSLAAKQLCDRSEVVSRPILTLGQYQNDAGIRLAKHVL